MRRFDGKVVLITGSASGIGRATALRIAAEGGSLILADRNREGVEAVAKSALEAGAASATALGYDAADRQSCVEMAADAIALHGRLDCLINNAGIYRRGHFLEAPEGEWEQIVAINLTSYHHIIRAVLPELIRTGGNVVSTASTAGVAGIAYASAYAAAKAGVIALTKSLAAEFAPHGVRFNVICPGRIKTDLGNGVPQVRDPVEAVVVRPPKLKGKDVYGDPEDIAAAFAFFASGDAAYASGAVLVIDGAQTVG